MQFLSIYLFSLLFHLGELQEATSDFEFNVTVRDPQNVIYEVPCKGPSEVCSKYKEELCSKLYLVFPSDMIPMKPVTQLCSATALTSRTASGTMDWAVKISVITKTSTGPLIDLLCPTFAGLLNYTLFDAVPKLLSSSLNIHVQSYKPIPRKLDPKEVTDVELIVTGQLCDGEFKPIPSSIYDTLDDASLQKAIKAMRLYAGMGYPLFTSPNVNILDFRKTLNMEKIMVTLKLLYVKSYVLAMKIDPYCDTAAILRMSLRKLGYTNKYSLCEPQVNVLPQPTTKPLTTTTTEITSTDLASIARSPVKTVVLTCVFAYIMVNN